MSIKERQTPDSIYLDFIGSKDREVEFFEDIKTNLAVVSKAVHIGLTESFAHLSIPERILWLSAYVEKRADSFPFPPEKPQFFNPGYIRRYVDKDRAFWSLKSDFSWIDEQGYIFFGTVRPQVDPIQVSFYSKGQLSSIDVLLLPQVPTSWLHMDNMVDLPLSAAVTFQNNPPNCLKSVEDDTLFRPMGWIPSLKKYGWMGWWPAEEIHGKRKREPLFYPKVNLAFQSI